MITLGVDPGRYKTAYALIQGGVPNKILAVESVHNGEILQTLKKQLSLHRPGVALVERPFKNKKRIDKEDLAYLFNLASQIENWLSGRGIRVLALQASHPKAWIDEEAPLGWRQMLTGLRYPNERDIWHYLFNLKKQGGLEGYIPRNENQVDALGMALCAGEVGCAGRRAA